MPKDLEPNHAEDELEEEEEGSPICFIEHANGEFRVTDEAKAMLSSIIGKLVVVCVAGPYRTGKSFLLNRLIGNQNGFKVSGTVSACTKGIWLWGRPITRGETSYLFLDTEGLGSVDQALPYDTKIFSLGVLLSSFFILNTSGAINEHALNELELVVNCANQVRMYDNKLEEAQQPDLVQLPSSSACSDLASVFPSMLWVLRDFSLRLFSEKENRLISASDYLEECLSSKTSNQTKNRTRETIKAVFLHRDCRTLVRPVVDEEQLQNLSSVASSQLRPEFVKQLDSLSALIFASARPKQINGALVNGAALLGLADAYTKTMNGGKMPVIYTAWEAVVMTQASQGVESALARFVDRLNHLCPPQTVVEREALDDAFVIAEKEAIHTLRSVCVGDEQTNRATEVTLLNKLTDVKRERVLETVRLSRLQCQQVLEEVWMDEKAVPDREFTQTIARAREQYYQKALGPCKDEVYAAFFEKKLLCFCNYQVEKSAQLTAQCEELQAKREEIRELHAEAVKTAEEQGVISERLEGELADLRQRHAALTTTSQAVDVKQRQQLHDLMEEKESLRLQLQQTKTGLLEAERVKDRAVTKQQKLKERSATLTTELQSEREKLSVLSHKHQELLSEQQRHKQQLEAMEASCHAVTAESLKQQTIASSAYSQERLQLSNSLEAQITLAREQQNQLTRLQEQVLRLENEKAQREEIASAEATLQLKKLQNKPSRRARFLDSDTTASLFFCLFVIVLGSRFGLGPAWL